MWCMACGSRGRVRLAPLTCAGARAHLGFGSLPRTFSFLRTPFIIIHFRLLRISTPRSGAKAVAGRSRFAVIPSRPGQCVGCARRDTSPPPPRRP
ncbi:hypothetical protein EVAR_86534_1 [Eumeta japonica]|uniref:Uncharacterized protein n=1 Tax=Eumeta variegata TaxID=151549 RepID=A0A4C1VMQ0_EUMVA|nr:hypothetical protein EVAR_86534_1 [Eumeta japonica]